MPQLQPNQSRASSEDTPVNALAEATDTAVEVVKALYEKEVAALQASATVTAFIGVIATQRVKRQLRRPGVASGTGDVIAMTG